MKLTLRVFIILPTSIVWLITALFLLVYGFELILFVFPSNVYDLVLNPGIFLLFITACLATLALYTTGHAIDKNTKLLKPLTKISLFMSGVCLLLIVIGTEYQIFLFLGLPGLGISLGILATTSGVVFGYYSEIDNRGRLYALAIILSALFSIFSIILLNSLNIDFRIHLFLIGLISILSAIVIHYISRSIEPWRNDPYPTSIIRIFDRRSVKAYLAAHFFIYLMIGIAFSTISRLGLAEDLTIFLDLFIIEKFSIDQNTFFWLLVFIGDLFFIWPMALLSDKIGRKTIMVLGCYGIVFAAIIVGLGTDILSYYLSAFILGGSFATMHPSIDSAVWADLSPLDSLGRYYALGFISLLQGIGVGLAIGLLFSSFIGSDMATISYVLIGLAILGMFFLFFVVDSFMPIDIFLLLLSRSGMLIFSHDFQRGEEISDKDLTLVTGALSAINTIFTETIHEQEAALDLVRHGNVFIVQSKVSTEKGELLATVFANKNDPEIYRGVRLFLTKFAHTFEDELQTWVGRSDAFLKAIDIAEDVFGPLIPSKTFSTPS
ncbi:MAG: MFS transporter [Candidatus Hodarchaeota archaeon]